MEGVCYFPDQAQATVPAEALSHSAKLTAFEIGEDSTTLSTVNGILYSKDRKTLIACPAAIGDSVVIDKDTTTIGPYAFAGTPLQSIVVQGTITSIDATAFNSDTKQNATIVISAGDTDKQVWIDAGFTHFEQPAKPGDTEEPKQDTSGYAYTLLDDMTLSVSWQGDNSPNQDLTIPASAKLNGVSYRVSSVASHAFENTDIKTLTIPSSVTVINDSAFKGCTNLKSVSLTEGLTSLGASAFEGTGLVQIILPKSVSSIETRALAANPSLTHVIALGSIASVADTVLSDCSQVSVLYPYDKDTVCQWSPGLLAQAIHVEAYGFDTSQEALELEVGTSASLFEEGETFLPEGVELSFSYPSRSLSVDREGTVKALGVGTDSVVATISLDGQELALTTRVVVATSAPKSSDSDQVTDSPDIDSLTDPTDSTDPRNLSSPSSMPFASPALLGATGVVGSNIEYTHNGKTLIYKVLSLSSDGKTGTVQVGTGAAPTIQITGDVVVPGTFVKDGVSYTVTGVGDNAFSQSSVASVVLPNTVTSIGLMGFYNIGLLQKVNIPASVKSIGGEAFANNLSLCNVEVDAANAWFFMGEDGVLYGRESAGGAVTRILIGLPLILKGSYSMPNTITSIDNRAFTGCTSMTSASMSLSVKTIGDFAFISTGLTSLAIPETVTAIGSNPVRGCNNLTELTVAEANKNFAVYQGALVELKDGVVVRVLGSAPRIVSGCFVMPETVTAVDFMAFVGCTKLTAVIIPVITKGYGGAFDRCTGLTDIVCYSKSITPSANFTNIPDATKASITVFLPSGTDRTPWTSAGFKKFADAPPITVSFDAAGGSATTLQLLATGEKVVRPSDPVRSGYLFGGWWTNTSYATQWNFDTPVSTNTTIYARWYAAGDTFEQDGFKFTLGQDLQTFSVAPLATNPLGAITLPSAYSLAGVGSLPVAHIDAQAFKDKATLTSVTIPSSIKSMGDGAFQNCSALTNATFDSASTMASIPAFAFAGCTKLSALTLPLSVVSLGEGAFQGCITLKNLPAGGSVATLGKSVFSGCTSLSEVSIPDTVTSLGTYAFTGCTSLTRINLGVGITQIPEYAFFNCEAITYLESQGQVTSIATDSPTNDSAFTNSVKRKAVVALSDTTSTSVWTTAGFLRVGANTSHSYSFDTQGGIPEQIGGELSPSKLIPAPLPITKQGYSFAHWSDLATNTIWNFTTDIMPATNLTLTAQWTAHTYTIKFNPNPPESRDPVGNTPDVAATYDTEALLPESGFTCKDYTFDGWNTAKDGSGTHYNPGDTVLNLSDAQGGTIWLYAQWKGAEYTVHFDSNAPAGVIPTGEMEPQTMHFAQWAVLSPNAYRTTGYIFKGWNTKADGTGLPFGDTDWVRNVAPLGATSTTLYAIWDEAYKVDVPLDPTITIDAQGNVTADKTSKFVNRGSATVYVSALEVTALSGANTLFSDPAKVELVMTTDVDNKPHKASALLLTGSIGYCKIPLSASSERLMSFTLVLPQDVSLTYKDDPVSVASLVYTFSVA